MGQSSTKYITIDVSDTNAQNDAVADLLVVLQNLEKNPKLYTALQITIINIPAQDAEKVKVKFDKFNFDSAIYVKRKFYDNPGTIRLVGKVGR